MEARSIPSGPLSDPVITAMAKLVDDGQAEGEATTNALRPQRGVPTGRRVERRSEATARTPGGKGEACLGRAELGIRTRSSGGERLVYLLITMIQALGGFRSTSRNFAGEEAISNARAVFQNDGYDLGSDGILKPLLLDSLSGRAATDALRAYITRAKRGADDAALVTGTGKDLLEATAKHVLMEQFGRVSDSRSFPTLLGQAFAVLGLAHKWEGGEPAHARVEAALYRLGCAANTLRNKEGTGHGRPFLSTVTDTQARTAIESMGIVAELLLNTLATRKP